MLGFFGQRLRCSVVGRHFLEDCKPAAQKFQCSLESCVALGEKKVGEWCGWVSGLVLLVRKGVIFPIVMYINL